MTADEQSARRDRMCAAPIMIVGAPRSGTTWIQRLLLADERCCGGQESHFFVTFGRVLHDFDDKASRERRHGLACYWSRAAFLAEIAGVWRRTMTPTIDAAPGSSLLIEKTPDHATCLNVIAEILPGARYVHVVRDSRAVCASLLAAGRASWGRGWAPQTVEHAIEIWTTHVDAAAAFDGAMHAVRYEDVHADPATTLSALWEHAGLDLDPARFEEVMADAAASSTFDGTGDVRESAEPRGFFGAGAPDGWRETLTARQARTIWKATADRMERLGYDPSGRAS